MKSIKENFIINYIKDFISFEGVVIISSTIILTTIVAFSGRLELLWPESISVFGLNIPGFRIFAWMINQVILLLLFPIIILLFYKKSPRAFGIQIKEIGKFWYFIIGASIFIIILTYFVSKGSDFQEVYPMYKYGLQDFKLLLIYELIFLIYLFSWEFFFRGYLLFGLEKKFGNYTILIQLVPFVLMHFAKPPLEIYSSILGGIILGVVALKTRSMVPCWILHLLFSLPMDFFVFLNK